MGKRAGIRWVSLVLTLAAPCVHGQSAPNSPAKLNELPEVAEPPAWIQWLGWSPDSRRLAIRQGSATEPRRPGLPIEINRLDAHGAVVERAHVERDVLGALHQRRIHVEPPVAMQVVKPSDVLLKANRGELFAIAVRGDPAYGAVLVKDGSEYVVRAQWPVRSPAKEVTAFAWQSPDGRLLAIVATTGTGARSQAQLVVMPVVDLPKSATNS